MSDTYTLENEEDVQIRQQLQSELDEFQTEPMAGGIAIDLVTRQTVFVRQRKFDNLVEHYKAEGYSLATYNQHPYLGVTLDDAVYEVVYMDSNPQNAHKVGKCYDMPRSRLCVLPVQNAWE